MSEHWDVTIVGAGVIGLAVAAELTKGAGLSVLVLERNTGPGQETSSRNSEVIHAGIYYPTGSLKAQLCVQGNRLLYEFCRRTNIAYRQIGKLIVACSDDECPNLETLYEQGRANGVEGLRMIGRREIGHLEPQVNACAALYSEWSGILDSHGFIKALEGQTRNQGGEIVYGRDVKAIETHSKGFSIQVKERDIEETLNCRILINSAGLESDRISAMVGVDKYKLWWCKGNYFSVLGSGSGGRAPKISHLVYPTPGAHLVSLGIHATLDLAGRMRLGPDVTYIDRSKADLSVDEKKATTFFRAAKRYLPGLSEDMLSPDMAGIRPKLQGPNDPWQDFVIKEESSLLSPAGSGRFINLIGIESPGLTSALAIGQKVRQIVQGG